METKIEIALRKDYDQSANGNVSAFQSNFKIKRSPKGIKAKTKIAL
jgi:hypothetical protein